MERAGRLTKVSAPLLRGGFDPRVTHKCTCRTRGTGLPKYIMAIRDVIQKLKEAEASRAVLEAELESEIRARLVASALVVPRKEEKAVEVAQRLVSELKAGTLPTLHDGIGAFDGWLERAGLLGLLDLPPMNDGAFATAALDRERGVVGVFVEQYLTTLGAYLRSKCDEEDTRSKDQATEIASEVIEECLAGKLRKYSGKGSLEGWLRRVCRNRLHDWREKGMREQLSDTVGEESDGEPWSGPAEDEKALFEAIRHGFTWLKRFHPEELVVIRLVYLHKIPQRTIAPILGVDAAEITRMKNGGMASLRTEITRSLEMRGHEYTWEQIATFIARHPCLASDEDAVVEIPEV